MYNMYIEKIRLMAILQILTGPPITKNSTTESSTIKEALGSIKVALKK